MSPRPFAAWALGVAQLEVLKWRQRVARSREVLAEDAMRLSPAHRVVVQLDLDGNLYRKIAERLQIPLGTVRSRLNRARVKLRKELAQYLPDSPGALKRPDR